MYSGLLLSFCLLKTHPFLPINCNLTFRSASLFVCNTQWIPMDRTKFMTCCCFLSFSKINLFHMDDHHKKKNLSLLPIHHDYLCENISRSLFKFKQICDIGLVTSDVLTSTEALNCSQMLNHVIIRSSCSSRSAVIKTNAQQAKYYDIFQIYSFFNLTDSLL